jgi:hypothetical protein
MSNAPALRAIPGVTLDSKAVPVSASLGTNAELAAYKQTGRMASRESLVVAIGDVFFLLALLFVGIAILIPLMKRLQMAVGGGDGGN